MERVPCESGPEEEELAYRLDPGEFVLVGIGFMTQMPFPVFYRIEERSGLSTLHGIEIYEMQLLLTLIIAARQEYCFITAATNRFI